MPSKDKGQKTIGLMDPPLDISKDQEESLRVSLRFNKIGKTSGFGIARKNECSKNEYNLASVSKRRNQWIQQTLLNPESVDVGNSIQGVTDSPKVNQRSEQAGQSVSYGGIFLLHEKGTDRCAVLKSGRAENVNFSWNEKDQIILEYEVEKSTLQITVVNSINLEQKSIVIAVDYDLSSAIKEYSQNLTVNHTSSKESIEEQFYQRDNSLQNIANSNPISSNSASTTQDQVHFAIVLDHIGDHVEILGDPEMNHIKQKVPPQLSSSHLFDLSQKYYLDSTCCSQQIQFDNKSIDCVLVSTESISNKLNKCEVVFHQSLVVDAGKDNSAEKDYYFAYFKPCLPFPSEKIYIKRIAFLIEDGGEGEFYIGLTREAYAMHNADLVTSRPEESWHGRRMIFKSGIKPDSGRFGSSFSTGSLVILEYDPFVDRVTLTNSFGQKSIINNLYADYSEKEFQDKQNRYCFCVGGAKGFRVCLYNDYFDDIQDSITRM